MNYDLVLVQSTAQWRGVGLRKRYDRLEVKRRFLSIKILSKLTIKDSKMRRLVNLPLSSPIIAEREKVRVQFEFHW